MLLFLSGKTPPLFKQARSTRFCLEGVGLRCGLVPAMGVPPVYPTAPPLGPGLSGNRVKTVSLARATHSMARECSHRTDGAV